MKNRTFLLAGIGSLIMIFSCDDGNSNNNDAVLENKRRVECEKRSPVCNGNDAMRFYQSIPLIQQDAAGKLTLTNEWSSFVICCDDFTRIMDSLTVYNHLFDSINYLAATFSRTDTIGHVIISASCYYLNEWSGKRYESLSFGDSSFTWLMPTGQYFDAHKRELEEAYTRCCVL